MGRGVARRAAGLLLTTAVGAGAAGACSLGLDPSLIGQQGDGAAPGGNASGEGGPKADGAADGGADAPASTGALDGAADGASGDAARADGDGARVLPPGSCSTDADCQGALADGGCVTGATCDTSRNVCVLAVCGAGACRSSACDGTANRCGAPKSYGFSAGHFAVTPGGIASGAVGHSIAAVTPFVFVLTTNGVAAYVVPDPTSASPTQVTVDGVPFIPTSVVAVGSRVYLVGGVQGAGPTFREAIAWIDVPGDPRVASLTAASAWIGTTQSALAAAYTNGVDGVYLVYSSSALFPTANARPPLTDSTLLPALANTGLATGASIVASSLGRLVAYRYDSTNLVADFALVAGAATSSAQAMPEQTVSAYAPLAGQAAFATGGDGSVLWTTTAILTPAGGTETVSAMLTWLLAGSSAGAFDTTQHVTLESYARLAAAAVPPAAPPAWLDANTAVALAAAAENTQTTSVQLATRQPPALQAGIRAVLPVAPGAVGVATSKGFAYVLAADDPKNVSASVYVFAPSCASMDP